MEDPIPLAKTDSPHLAPSFGDVAMGRPRHVSYGATHTDRDIHEAFRKSIEGGIDFSITAELYGKGAPEVLLGEWPERDGAGRVRRAEWWWQPSSRRCVPAAQGHAGRGAGAAAWRDWGSPGWILYQIHFPFFTGAGRGMGQCAGGRRGSGADALGGGIELQRRADAAGARSSLARGIPLASNQVEYHLLHRKWSAMAYCKPAGNWESRDRLQALLPRVWLTRQVHAGEPPAGLRKYMARGGKLSSIQPLLGLMRELGQAHEGKSPAQVALRLARLQRRGAHTGAKNGHQARRMPPQPGGGSRPLKSPHSTR